MKNYVLTGLVWWLIMGTSCTLLRSGEQASEHNKDIIAASQTGAKPLFFDPGDATTETIAPGTFQDTLECMVRGGLPHFFDKAENGKSVTIGYIGGSITRGENMYRNQSAKFIQSIFPDVKMNAINTGVSGTGTDLGACRIHDQLLKYHPDLIFIEFAVNGAFRPGMEGMIRQIWRYDPTIDICLLYTIGGNQWKEYAKGQIPENIRGLEDIAEYYHIPSVHMAIEASMLAKAGKLMWKGDVGKTDHEIVFSGDGIHPLKAGGDLYAKAIARGMLKLKKLNPRSQDRRLGTPLLADNWEDAQMLDPRENATFSGEWEPVDPLMTDSLRQFKPWFPYLMKSGTPGASFSFQFNGEMVGLFDIGGPEAGQLSLTVDGKKMSLLRQSNTLAWKVVPENEGAPLLNRFNKYCNNRYRGQCEFIALKPGLHKVTFSISPEKADKAGILGTGHLKDMARHPERYNQTVELLGKILIRGEIVGR